MALGQKVSVATSFPPPCTQDILLHPESLQKLPLRFVSSVWLDAEMGESVREHVWDSVLAQYNWRRKEHDSSCSVSEGAGMPLLHTDLCFFPSLVHVRLSNKNPNAVGALPQPHSCLDKLWRKPATLPATAGED